MAYLAHGIAVAQLVGGMTVGAANRELMSALDAICTPVGESSML